MRRRISHKFQAKSVEQDGKKFGSQLENRYYQQLKIRKRSGEILFFLMQVPIDLPGGIKYRIDFVEFHANGEVVFTEVKGMRLTVGQMKIKQVEDLYPITINVITKV